MNRRSVWRQCAVAAAALLAALAFGLPASAADGRDSVSETFGNWIVRCLRTAKQGAADSSSAAACQMSQELLSSDTGRRVLLFVLPAPTAEESYAAIITPLGLDLEAGVMIEVDGVSLFKAPYRTCVRQGCSVRIRLEESTVANMKRGKMASVVMTTLNGGKRLRVDVSLAGFTSARKRLTELARDFD